MEKLFRKVTKWRVITRESERGWGSSYETDDFNTKEAADAYVLSINSQNTATEAPDWYMTAGQPEKVEVYEEVQEPIHHDVGL